MTNVSVTWDGEEISAIILVALVTARTAQATEYATPLLTSALVTKAGLAKAAKSPTAQVPLTASSEEYVTPLWIPLSVKTALMAGWVRLVTILAHTDNKFPWIAVTVFVSQVGSVLGAIVSAQSMER